MAQSGYARTVKPSVETLYSGETPRRLPGELQVELLATMRLLLEDSHPLQGRNRVSADRAIGRLSRLLDYEHAWVLVEPWLENPNFFRRKVVARIMRANGVPSIHRQSVINLFRDTQDRDLLKVIEQHRSCAELFTEEDVCSLLAIPLRDDMFRRHDSDSNVYSSHVISDSEGRYWRMRAISTYIAGGHVPSRAIALAHPMEFAWAVGRQESVECLPLLMEILEHFQNDPELVWRTERALSQIGCVVERARAHALAADLVAKAAKH